MCPQQVVLDRLSLRLEPGKVLALCGASGGGKSSVMALLQVIGRQTSNM